MQKKKDLVTARWFAGTVELKDISEVLMNAIELLMVISKRLGCDGKGFLKCRSVKTKDISPYSTWYID